MHVKTSVSISLFAVLTSIGALIIIPLPFSPVPISLQTLFCVLSGLILGRKSAMLSQMTYLALGMAGLPVFSRGGSGFAVFLGPSGGYLAAFPFAAYAAGFFAEKDKALIAIIAANTLIYLAGISYLSLLMQTGAIKALSLGFLPFVPGLIFKSLIAYTVYRSMKKNGMLSYIRRTQ